MSRLAVILGLTSVVMFVLAAIGALIEECGCLDSWIADLRRGAENA
jgi:hypothetical protein